MGDARGGVGLVESPPLAVQARAMPAFALWPVAAYLCLLGPGQAWIPPGIATRNRGLLGVAVSVAWTSIVGLALAACGAYSLDRVLGVGAVATALGATLRYARGERPALPDAILTRSTLLRTSRGLMGPLLAVAALLFYWPPYETHFAGTDSTGYVAAGIQLARTGALERDDPVGAALPPLLKKALFRPALDKPGQPPFHRQPGAMNLRSLEAGSASPNFFPVPMIWSAIAADLAGRRYAGGYAPLFAALSLWALHAFARRRLGEFGAVALAAVMGLGLAGYWAARFALSEPITCFALWSGLVAVDDWSDSCSSETPPGSVSMNATAALAGFLVGTAGLVRLDYALFIAAALATRYLLIPLVGGRQLPAAFHAGFGAATALLVVEIASIPGGYVLPVTNALAGVGYRIETLAAESPVELAAAALVVLATVAVGARTVGLVRVALGGTVAAFVLGYTLLASSAQIALSYSWLANALGLPTILVGTVGLAALWASRGQHPTNDLLVPLVVLTGALLIYDPHVQPFMLWGLRRFTPLLIPALLVSAGAAVAVVWRRFPPAGALIAAVVALSVLVPARGLWRRPLYAGAYDRLAGFDAILPSDAILLVDRPLASYMLGSGLWMVHDRECIPVDTTTELGRKAIPGLVGRLRGHGRVLLVQDARQRVPSLPLVRSKPMMTHQLEILFPDQPSVDSRVGSRSYTLTLAVAELIPYRVVPGQRRGPARSLVTSRRREVPMERARQDSRDREPASGLVTSRRREVPMERARQDSNLRPPA